ncbi:hypothetical protein [uncultured Allobaculum sp.]|uniref:hypothetical protein n=1 Tax=uncultured Allobaculum sp. TaxID=1187017 RepID=UPI00259B0EEC|nr:hypothetical protein [uncultured Allobaculum sp.]
MKHSFPNSQFKSSGKKGLPSVSFRTLIGPIVALSALSLIYGLAYTQLFLGTLALSGMMATLLRILLLTGYGIGLYGVCVWIWGKKEGAYSGRSLGRAGLGSLFVAWLVSFVLEPLSYAASPIVEGFGNVLGILAIFFVLPGLIVFFQAVYTGAKSWSDLFSTMATLFQKAPAKRISVWLALFLLLWLADLFLGGPLCTVSTGAFARLFATLVSLGQPGCSLLLLLFAQNGSLPPALWIGYGVQFVAVVILSAYVLAWQGKLSESDTGADSSKNGKPRCSRKGDRK